MGLEMFNSPKILFASLEFWIFEGRDLHAILKQGHDCSVLIAHFMSNLVQKFLDPP